MLDLQHILNHVSSAPTADLHAILCAIQDELPKRDGNLSNLVEYIPDFCSDGDLLDRVWGECESLELSSKRTKAPTQWISPSDEPYIYTDGNPLHHAKDIGDFKAIKELLSRVNDSNLVTGPLDACLLTKYNSHQASLTMHADDESNIIDQDKAICSFSLGCERTIEFFKKSNKPKLVKKIRMGDNSVVVMRPGTQQKLKHCVRNEPRTKSTELAGKSQLRYSLSFRALAKKHPGPAVTPPLPRPENVPAPAQDSTPKKKICLVAGDSFAARLDKDRLGKKKLVVENIAEGGSKLFKVRQQLMDFVKSNPDTDVTKIIISVGTNDIRNCKNGINHLRGPLKELCNTISELFPNSTKVFFQSLLPLPLKHENDWYTNDIVIDFNWLIYNECIHRQFYYIDAFGPFTKFSRKVDEPFTRFDNLFEINGIHPNSTKGMGVLARMYIRAFHSKYFNPMVFQ